MRTSPVGRHPHAGPGDRRAPGVEVSGSLGGRELPARSRRQGVAALRAGRADAQPTAPVGRHPHADPGARRGPGVEVSGALGRRAPPGRSRRQGVAALRAGRADARDTDVLGRRRVGDRATADGMFTAPGGEYRRRWLAVRVSTRLGPPRRAARSQPSGLRTRRACAAGSAR
jgi:hypothetical protein